MTTATTAATTATPAMMPNAFTVFSFVRWLNPGSWAVVLSRPRSDRFQVTHTETVMVNDQSGYHESLATSSMTAMTTTRLPHEGKLATSDDHGQAFCGTIEANMCHRGLN